MSRSEAEREVERLKGLSVGPVNSAVLVHPSRGAEIFFKVRWVPALERVVQRLRDGDSIDVRSHWLLFSIGSLRLVLDITWPELGERVILYFEDIERWRTELELVVSNDGILFLVPEDADAKAMLEIGLGVEAETNLLHETLALHRQVASRP